MPLNTSARGSGVASANFSTAEGRFSTASSEYAHAEGDQTTASGQASHAEGLSTTASGSGSHAEGSGSVASGSFSHAQGNGAKARGVGQAALASGFFSAVGDAQVSSMHVLQQTTNATPVFLLANKTSSVNFNDGSANTLLMLGTTHAAMLRVSVVARRTDVAGEIAGFSWQGLVGRDTGSIRVIGSPAIQEWGDTGTEPWSMTVSTEQGASIVVVATGEAGKTIKWSGVMEWVEIS